MTGSSHPRFWLLTGWCCLMSAALLILTVILATRTSFNKQLNTNTTDQRSREAESVKLYSEQLKGFPPGQSFRNYIRLIRGGQSWICDMDPPCQTSFLSLQNNNVGITISGFYYFNAQVYFHETKNQSKQMMKHTVTLVPTKGESRLSEVIIHGGGSVSLTRMVRLKKGDNISLDIHPQSILLSKEHFHTYWEIILLFKE